MKIRIVITLGTVRYTCYVFECHIYNSCIEINEKNKLCKSVDNCGDYYLISKVAFI